MTKKRKKKTSTKRLASTKRKGVMRTPPFPALPEWSTSKFFGFIRSGLRAKFTRWPPKYQVLAAAKRAYVPKDGKKSRQKFEYKCSVCCVHHPNKEVEVDHIIPCGSLKSFEDLAGFAERMFCGVDHLRVVCKECHRRITAEERRRKK